MKFQSILLTLMSLSLSSASYSLPYRIDRCPSALAIKQSGFKEVLQMGNDFWAYQISNFNTKNDWRFTTAVFKAASRQMAYAYAMNQLETIHGSPVINYDPKTNTWSCTYQMSQDFTGVATTPIIY